MKRIPVSGKVVFEAVRTHKNFVFFGDMAVDERTVFSDPLLNLYMERG